MENQLRELRMASQATPQEMVDLVRVRYPKYDRTLQSKCEHTDLYGVELTYPAFRDLVIRLLGKAAWDQYKKRTDGHKDKKRIMIRMDDETFRRFMAQIVRDVLHWSSLLALIWTTFWPISMQGVMTSEERP